MDNRDDNYDDDSNTSLYLVLGGLLVVAIVFGFSYWGRHNNNNLANIEPASGTPYSATTTGNSDNTGYGTNNNTNSPGTNNNNTGTTP